MEMIRIKIQSEFYDLINAESHAQGVAFSTYAEEMIRNGIAISMLLEKAVQEKQDIDIKLYSTMIRTWIDVTDITDGSIKLEPHILSSKLEERMKQFAANNNLKKKKGTSYLVTEGLMEYLVTVSAQMSKPLSFVFLVFFQLGLSAWHYRQNLYEGIPAAELERTHKILDITKFASVDFDYEGGMLQVLLKLNDGQKKTSTDIVNVMKLNNRYS